jgi:hypothetical protein
MANSVRNVDGPHIAQRALVDRKAVQRNSILEP